MTRTKGGPKSIFAITWCKYNTHVHHTLLKTHFRVPRIARMMCRRGQNAVRAPQEPASLQPVVKRRFRTPHKPAWSSARNVADQETKHENSLLSYWRAGIEVLRQAAGMPALGVLEERFGLSCTSFGRFGAHGSVFLAVYGGRVRCIYAILLRISISDPLLMRFIFCTTPHTLG